MPWPTDYSTPEGQELAELAIRQAILDIFLSVATPYGFTSDVGHLDPRYVQTVKEYEVSFTVVDPDTATLALSKQRRLHRYFSVQHVGFTKTQRLLSLKYDLIIAMGFRDRYKARPTIGTFAEIVALNMRLERVLSDNQGLGLDDGVLSHRFLQSPARPRFVALNDQGETSVVLDDSLIVDLRVC